MTTEPRGHDRLDNAVRKAEDRQALRKRYPEPSLGRRLGQIGVLGWIIVFPLLAGLLGGHWLDRQLETRILFTGAFTAAGAALGLWLAFRWMQEQK